DMIWKYCVSPPPEDKNNYSKENDVLLLFLSGKSAMLCSGIWDSFSLLNHAKFEWGLTMFPDHQKGIGGSCTGYSIPTCSKYPEPAWRFIKFFSGYPGQKTMAESGLIQPSIRGLAYTND